MYFQNQFGQYQQNVNMNNNIKNVNEEDEEKDIEYKGGDKLSFALKRKFISKYLVNFCKNEKNKQLDELLSDLILYKIDKKNLEEINFRKLIFENIEKMIIEISCIRNEEIRMTRIHRLFSWYKEKIKLHEDLRKIQEKSYKEKNEIDDEEKLYEKELKKKNEKEEIINEEEKNVKENLKHRNKDMLYKDMLIDYKRKLIKTPETSNNIIPEKNEKNLYKTLSSNSFKNFSHTGEMTTFYSTKKGKNSFTLRKNLGLTEQNYYSLYNDNNKKYFPPLNREVKYSYSYNRPEYNYNTMIIENNVLENKIKNFREKRTKEEIEEKIQKFGADKAKYKESLLNKYELKNIINMYTNTNKFNSHLLEKYKFKTPITGGKKKFTKKYSIIEGNTTNENNIYDNIINDDNQPKQRNIMKRSYSQVVKKFNFLKETSKIEIDKIKNFDNNTKSVLEKDKEEIKIIKIKLKQPKDKIKKKYVNLRENYSDIPNDVISDVFHKNPLFKQKFLYDKICGIKFKKDEINNKEDSDESENEYHNFYMSAYDFGNIRKLDKFSKTKIENDRHNKTRNGNVIETFDSNKDNFLNFRKTMSFWKKNNFEKLYNKIMKSKEMNEITNYIPESKYISFRRKINLRERKQNSLVSAMINPIEESLYPRYFLPRSGSMLLKRKVQNDKKTKSKKKK